MDIFMQVIYFHCLESNLTYNLFINENEIHYKFLKVR